MSRLGRTLPTAWAFVLGILMLGPALGSGYVLSYDMVWVPDLSLRTDFLGLASGLPRAVPSDAVVAVLDEVVPGMLLQKLVLLGSLLAAGAGAAALVSGLPTIARCGAVTFYLWNPLVVERLALGHWPLLLTYAVLPWLILTLTDWRRGGHGRAWWLLVPLGSLSPSGGVLVAVVAFISGGQLRTVRRCLELIAVVLAGNAPWLVSGALHASAARVNARSIEVFALHGEGILPAPLAALSLGGIWNADVTPGSRDGVPAVIGLLLLLLVCAGGVRRWNRIPGRHRFLALWLVGITGALLTWVLPNLLGALSATVPGAGLMRDGSRMLLVCAPLVAVLVGYGLDGVERAFHVRWQSLVTAGCLAVAPIAVMPDAALGLSGRLEPTSFPTSYDEARTAVGSAGDVVVLPFTSYRAPRWNARRAVLDPLPRYLRPNYVASDELYVDGRPMRGEDPRADAVAAALAGPRPTEDLASLGIRTVVVDHTAGGTVPDIRGEVLLPGSLEVVRIPAPAPSGPPQHWLIPVGLAWVALLGLLLAGLVINVRAASARMRSRSPTRW